MKAAVPSIGSSVSVYSASALPVAPNSSPRMRTPGKSVDQHAPHSLAVGRGHERLIGLALGGDVPKEDPRELAGLDDGRQQRLHGGTGHAGTIA
jgi:hypothetical protein